MSALLPTKLRTAANGMKGIHAEVAREAADEIDRLSAALVRAYATMHNRAQDADRIAASLREGHDDASRAVAPPVSQLRNT